MASALITTALDCDRIKKLAKAKALRLVDLPWYAASIASKGQICPFEAFDACFASLKTNKERALALKYAPVRPKPAF